MAAGFGELVENLGADVVVLNEYVHGPTRAALLADLTDIEFSHVLVSERKGKGNQILIASRYEIVKGDLTGPATEDGGGESNFLHIKMPSEEIEVIGIRVPAYPERRKLENYWSAFNLLARSVADRRILIVGDFNADPDATWHIGGPHLARLRETGWHLPSPSGEWSFKSGSRIDHVLASRSLPKPSAAYVTECDGTVISSREGKCLSDHAMLVVDFNTKERVRRD